MRIMFTMPPHGGGAFALVPLAQAATLAGHDVIFATASSTVGLVADAGLHAVDVAPDADFDPAAPDATMAFLSNRPDADPVSVPGPHFFQRYADAMADGLIRLAAAWRADVVVHSPDGVAARTVFEKLGVPTVFHGTGFTHHPNAVEPWKRANSAHTSANEWGITAAIDVSPPSMSLVDEYGWRMRYVPYNGGGALPRWLFEDIPRPRIAVTLGTVAPGIVGIDPLYWVLAAAAEVDAEFVFALGGADPGTLGALPDNVRAVRWVPLNALLRTCAAVVHHGGSGSTMAALNAGLPQIVLPQGADQFDNARAIAQRGVGFVASTVDSAAEAMHRVLSESALRSAAREVHAELSSLPSPVEVMARLAEHLAAAHLDRPTT
jgi:UDP:flavonoid glycosyltransferase YjiC (YdhE family)